MRIESTIFLSPCHWSTNCVKKAQHGNAIEGNSIPTQETTTKCINSCLIDVSQVILKLIWGQLIKPSTYCQSFNEHDFKRN